MKPLNHGSTSCAKNSLGGMFAQQPLSIPVAPPLWMDVPSRKRPAFAGMTVLAGLTVLAAMTEVVQRSRSRGKCPKDKGGLERCETIVQCRKRLVKTEILERIDETPLG